MEHYKIQLISKIDVPFLWDMLYEIRCVRCLREGKNLPSRDILNTPELAKYVQNWGRIGDKGFVAISTDNQSSIGAAWYRLFKEDDQGYGYVDSETPEIAIAILPEYRNKGLGQALMLHLLEQAKSDSYQQISLSCGLKNANALHLYQKVGFEKVEVFDISCVMKKVLI
ncbi:MAG: GNAT family N-acetyltransferase [Gloeocapsa sp. UFS-A4-WI-NPMV-4B04]|jgi:ribosomal protein S18 acetylase RimI-like enzyme|nr:GNAT family N-acetyltransferase [Gloeocapsa sp. UFS-A4-WI-NPMV-4B04]